MGIMSYGGGADIPEDEDSKEWFERSEKELSVTYALANFAYREESEASENLDPNARPFRWAVIGGVPLVIYLIGLAIAFATGWGQEYLLDPVPPVFAITTMLFLEGVWKFDRNLFSTVGKIENAFDEPPERFYGFFGELVTRLYEPWFTGRRVSLTHPTRLAYIGALAYVVLLAVTGIGNPPSDRPWPNIAFFWGMTVVGLIEVVALLWAVAVMFAYMARHAQRLEVALDPLREPENLGLQPYGTFVVAITSRIFLVLAVGGFGVLTTPSPFTVTLFVGGIIVFLAWFASTQYGLHIAIVNAKERYREELRAVTPKAGFELQSSDDPDIDRVREARDAVLYARHLENLPDWPITWKNLFRLAGSLALTLLSVGTQLQDLLLSTL